MRGGAILVCGILLISEGQLSSEHTGECATLRRQGNETRALALFVRNQNPALSYMRAMLDAGFRLGVFHRGCGEREQGHRRTYCQMDMLRAGSPPELAYVRASESETISPSDPTLQFDLIQAIAEWRPAIVLPEFTTSVLLMQRTAKRYASATNPLIREAVQRLRCSLPAEELWNQSLSKSRLILAAAEIGVRVPWTRRLPPEVIADPAGRGLAQILAIELPIVVKSDRDGNGLGVSICNDRDCLIRKASSGSSFVLQQYVGGPTVAFEGSALDGELLAGFARLELLTRGRRGVTELSRTLAAPELSRMSQTVLRHLRHTGAFGFDFVIDARTGVPYLIDPNLRFTFNLCVDAAMLGLDEGPLERLRLALSGERALSHWRPIVHEPPRVSVTYARFNAHAREWPDLYFCPNVYVPFPHGLGEYAHALNPQLTFTIVTTIGEPARSPARRCYYRHNTKPSWRLLEVCGLRTGPCANASVCRRILPDAPLRVPTLADAVKLCASDRNLNLYANCRNRRMATDLKLPPMRAPGPGYWGKQGWMLCRTSGSWLPSDEPRRPTVAAKRLEMAAKRLRRARTPGLGSGPSLGSSSERERVHVLFLNASRGGAARFPARGGLRAAGGGRPAATFATGSAGGEGLRNERRPLVRLVARELELRSSPS
jgi:hypothetical protein